MTLPLDDLPRVALAFLLMFSRFGMMYMIAPGFASSSLPARIRLAMALASTLLALPIVFTSYAPVAETSTTAIQTFFGEILIGGLMGILGRIILLSIQIAGTIAAFQLGFGFAQSVDLAHNEPSLLLETLFTQVALITFFALNLHHVLLQGLFESIQKFPPGILPPSGDFAQVVTRLIGDAFQIGVSIALPFIVFGLVFQGGLGLLSRLMPQLGVFFIAVPFNILLGLTLLLLVFQSNIENFTDFAGQVFISVFLIDL